MSGPRDVRHSVSCCTEAYKKILTCSPSLPSSDAEEEEAVSMGLLPLLPSPCGGESKTTLGGPLRQKRERAPSPSFPPPPPPPLFRQRRRDDGRKRKERRRVDRSRLMGDGDVNEDVDGRSMGAVWDEKVEKTVSAPLFPSQRNWT